MEIHRRIKRQFNRQWRTVDRDIQFVTQANSAGVFAPPKRARVRVRESCRQIFAAGNSVLTEAK